MAAPRYRSSIPAVAHERVVEKWPNGIRKRAEYWVKGRVVGVRGFFEDGQLEFECPQKDGKPHGKQYYWIAPGKLSSVEPYENGLAHGVAKQWSTSAKLIGTYRMNQGTGIDLWRQEREDGSVYLSEVLHLKAGRPVGFRWGINDDQRTIYLEDHYNAKGQRHGIWREWDVNGRLRPGFPKFFIRNRAVSKRRYIAACKIDSTLPPYRDADDSPQRVFPRRITIRLNYSRAVRRRRPRNRQ
jgi:hypothetical protein